MDLTFLFIIVLMLLAVKSGLTWIAAGLFLLLLFTAKSKYLFVAALVGFVLAVSVKFIDLGEYSMWVIVGSLGLVLFLIAKKESDQPGPGGYGQGGLYS